MNKYVTIGILLLIVILLVAFRNKLTALFTKQTPPPVVTPATVNTATQQGLDVNKLLKKGSLGEEVKQLQMWLGITADGNFGPQTEAALQARKNVTSITLSQFPTLPDVSTGSTSTGSWDDPNDDDGFVLTNPVTWF